MSEAQHERELPELSDAVLDPMEVEVLFADLAALTQVHEVILKHASRAQVPDTQQQVTLDEARELLLRRIVRGVQVRYTWQRKEYWDTLMALPNGVRIVRICHG